MNALRESCPVGWSDQLWHERGDRGFWVVNDYADVMAAATYPKGFINAEGATPVQFDLDVLRQIPLETDPPLHRRIRRMLNPFFTPEALRSREAGIAEKVDRLMTRCVERGTCDFIEDFVDVLPPLVFFESFLEQEELEISWVLDVLEGLHTQPERAAEEVPKLFKFCADLLQQRRSEGRRDDLAGTIAHMGLTGDDGLELTEKQRIEVINLMIMAGMATTMGAMGCTAYHLATNRDLRGSLRNADDHMIERAVEEFLRYESAVPTGARTLAEDVEMSGCPMKAGDRVLLNWAAANRDPAKFANPNELDFCAREHLRPCRFRCRHPSVPRQPPGPPGDDGQPQGDRRVGSFRGRAGVRTRVPAVVRSRPGEPAGQHRAMTAGLRHWRCGKQRGNDGGTGPLWNLRMVL